MAKQNNTHIRLIHADDHEETIRAPDGFTWVPYPEEIAYEGKRWKYVGALDAYPHYREVA